MIKILYWMTFLRKKYIVFKEDKRFAICIEGLKIENIKEFKLPIFRNKNKEIKILNNVFDKIGNLFKIYDVLDLGNDLYVIQKENNKGENSQK